MYLVDTNVISSAAPSTAPTHSAVVDWIEAHSDTLYVSIVTIAEIADGITKLHREGATRKAAGLKAWSDALLHLYAARILVVDVGIARRLGELSDRARSLGRAPRFADLAIAATAAHHNLTLLTRNVKPFEGLEIVVIDPLQALPPT